MPEEQQYIDSELQFGYWFTRHRVIIKAVILSIFYLIFGILIFYNAKQIIDFYAYDEIGRLQREINNTTVLSGDQLKRYSARDAQFDPPIVVSRGNDVYDLLVSVQNPNQRHKLDNVKLNFVIGSWSSDVVEDHLLPAEKKTIMLLNISDKNLAKAIASGATAKINVEEVDWVRIRDIQWFDERGNFIGVGLETNNATTEQIGASTRELRFDLINNSIFNYRSVEIRALLYNGGQVVGAQKLSVDEVRSDTVREQSLRWFYAIPQVTNWKIELSTDIFDENNILPFVLEQFE